MTEVRAELVGNVWKVEAAAGDRVEEDDILLILESMKMEIPVTAPVAGMGGRTIARMIEGGREVASGLHWLVLQPQQHVSELEEWLARAGYRLLAARDVDEGRRSYRVLVVEPPRVSEH